MLNYENLCPHCLKDNSDKEVLEYFNDKYEGERTEYPEHKCVHCKKEFIVDIHFAPEIYNRFDLKTFLKANDIKKPENMTLAHTFCLEEFLDYGPEAVKPKSWTEENWIKAWTWAKKIYKEHIMNKIQRKD